jgi:NADPH:quinone reductase-like Zn-dependent oxidoreductase
VWADVGGVKGDSGGMAQYALASEKQTGIAPSNINLTEAGTIPLAALTALEMWDKVAAAIGGSIPGNSTMVVTAGTGGTGFIGLQLGKKVYGANKMITSTSGNHFFFFFGIASRCNVTHTFCASCRCRGYCFG